MILFLLASPRAIELYINDNGHAMHEFMNGQLCIFVVGKFLIFYACIEFLSQQELAWDAVGDFL